MKSAHSTRVGSGNEWFRHANPAADTIQRERWTIELQYRTNMGTADPQELAAIVALPRNELPHGFSQLLQTAMGVRHG